MAGNLHDGHGIETLLSPPNYTAMRTTRPKSALCNACPRWRKGIAILFLVAVGALSMSRGDQPPFGSLKMGDNIDRLDLISESGTKTSMDSIHGKYKVLFHFQASQMDTGNKLKAVAAAMNIFRSAPVAYLMIWDQKIPEELLKQYKIDLSVNYSIRTDDRISAPKPSYCVLADEKGNIIMDGFYDYGDIVVKLAALYGGNETDDAVAHGLLEETRAGANTRRDPEKCNLFFFYTPGCHRCEDNLKSVKDNIALLRDKYNVFTVIPGYAGTYSSSDNVFKDSTIVDDFRIYENALRQKVDSFFIVTDHRGHFEGSIETLSEVLEYSDRP